MFCTKTSLITNSFLKLCKQKFAFEILVYHRLGSLEKQHDAVNKSQIFGELQVLYEKE